MRVARDLVDAEGKVSYRCSWVSDLPLWPAAVAGYSFDFM